MLTSIATRRNMKESAPPDVILVGQDRIDVTNVKLMGVSAKILTRFRAAEVTNFGAKS